MPEIQKPRLGRPELLGAVYANRQSNALPAISSDSGKFDELIKIMKSLHEAIEQQNAMLEKHSRMTQQQCKRMEKIETMMNQVLEELAIVKENPDTRSKNND